MLSPLEKYYNKHKEDLRLVRRHGQVEFRVSMKFIHDFLPKENKNLYRISDIGAGTGRYSIALFEEGFDVTAVELVQHNIDMLKKHNDKIPAIRANALDLSMLPSDSYDMTIFFGPLYHLHGIDNQLKALNEAKRITKNGGLILNAYVLNDYSLLTYCFLEDRMPNLRQNNIVDSKFKINCSNDELYEYARLEDIDNLNKLANLQRVTIFSPDGPSDFMRPILNKMSEESFERFVEYQIVNAERKELLGAGSHLVDVVRVIK